MRAFWIVVGVLMLLASGYLFYKAPAGLPAEQPQDQPASSARDPRLARSEAPAPRPPAPLPAVEEAAPAPSKPAAPEPAPEIAALPEATPAKAEPEAKPEAPAPVDGTLAEAPALAPNKPEPETPAEAMAATPPAAEAVPEAKPATTEAAAPAEAKIVKQEDGSLLVDGKFRMRGSGTAEDPYTVTWDQLTSIQDEYAPKDGRNVIPPRVKMLDGKHVRIEGNVAFPMMMDEAEELLVMLNQWDGCCIGVPPTPYDAVEVKLDEVVSGDKRMTTYGTLTGKFRVDPHLVGGWLVGLYVMEDAKLKPQAYGGFAP